MAEKGSNDPAGKPSFWKTVPGILTAGAALLGAISSLVTILISTGIIDPDSNDPPSVAGLRDQSGQELTELRYGAGDAFKDPEGETLIYSATLANGSPLPDWLWIDQASGEIQGRPRRGNAGHYAIEIKAADPAGATAAASFGLEIAAAAARRAKVRVTFKRIELHKLKEAGRGEIWLLLKVNGKRLRWPKKNGGYKNKGYYKMKRGETKAINKGIEVTVADGGRLEVFVNATEWDGGSATSNDPLGNVTRGYRVDQNLGARNPNIEKSTCPKGCFTIHYDISPPRWLP